MPFRPLPASIILALILSGCAPRWIIAQYGEGTGVGLPADSRDIYGATMDPYAGPIPPSAGYAYPGPVGHSQWPPNGALVPPPFPMSAGMSGATGRSHMPDTAPLPVFPTPQRKAAPRRNP